MGSIDHFFCIPKRYGCLREKYSWDCVSQELKRPFFFNGTPFSVQRRTDKLWLFRLSYLADIFSKMNKEKACHFRKRKWRHLLSMLKLEPSSRNWYFGKLLPATGSLTAFRYILTFFMSSMVILTNVVFKCYIVKFTKVCKIFIKYANVFQMIHAWW